MRLVRTDLVASRREDSFLKPKWASGVAGVASSAQLSSHLRVTGSRGSLRARQTGRCAPAQVSPGKISDIAGGLLGWGAKPSQMQMVGTQQTFAR